MTTSDLQAQIAEAQRRRDEALAAEQERQRRESAHVREAAEQAARIAELEAQARREALLERAPQVGQMIVQANTLAGELQALLRDTVYPSAEGVAKLKALYGRAATAYNQAGEADGRLYQEASQQGLTEVMTYDRRLRNPVAVVNAWFDAKRIDSPEALLAATTLYLVFGDKFYLKAWDAPAFERVELRRQQRYPNARV